MRRGTWILAISGMMALHQGGYAADPASGQASGRIDAGSSRNGTAGRSLKKSPSAAEAQPKNYYKDLFGDEDAAPSRASKKFVPSSAPPNTTPGDWADDSAPDTASTRTSSEKRSMSKGDESSSDIKQVGAKSTAGAADKSKSNSKVVQAVYDKPAGKKTPVQQVRADGRPRSAPPIQGIDEIIEAPAKHGPAKEHHVGIVHEESAATKSAKATAQTAQSEPQTSQVTVEWMKRGEFNVGQECLVDLVVKNTGATAVSQVAVDAYFPTNVRLTDADPRPASATDRLTWNIEQMAPASEHKITVKMIPSRRGEIAANAQVRYTGSSAAAFAVHEPMLKVAVKSPSKEIMLGDPASQMITVTNPGTGTAHDVKVEAKLSDGLEHPTREDHLVIDVGSVGPGETRTYRLGLTASKGGAQSISVVATSSCDASSSDSVEFNVIAPSLKIAVDGPSLRYKGRNAKYTVTVTNDGSLANNNVHVSQSMGEGFKFVSADHQGKFDSSVNRIDWFIGRMEPGESCQVTCELNSHQIGEFAHAVQVVSDSGVRADAKIDTRVDGIASLTMELADLDDPVETGAETAYEIRVKNDGSKAATGVVVACELPAGMDLISAKSPVDRIVEGRLLTFKPIDQIAPGEQVTFRIHMKVARDGSHRLRARLTGGGLQEPMLLEEVTRAYSDGSN